MMSMMDNTVSKNPTTPPPPSLDFTIPPKGSPVTPILFNIAGQPLTPVNKIMANPGSGKRKETFPETLTGEHGPSSPKLFAVDDSVRDDVLTKDGFFLDKDVKQEDNWESYSKRKPENEEIVMMEE